MSEIVPHGTNFVPHDIWWIYVADQSCGTIIFGNKSKNYKLNAIFKWMCHMAQFLCHDFFVDI